MGYPLATSFTTDITEEFCQIMAILVEKTKLGEISWVPQRDHHLVKSCVSDGIGRFECKIGRFLFRIALSHDSRDYYKELKLNLGLKIFDEKGASFLDLEFADYFHWNRHEGRDFTLTDVVYRLLNIIDEINSQKQELLYRVKSLKEELGNVSVETGRDG